jgi:hypothetical protein
MIRLAFAGKWGTRGASGLSATEFWPSAATNSEMIPGSNIDPPKRERSIDRRVQPQFE